VTYRGWRILAVVDIPHAYLIKDVHEIHNSVRFGKEIHWQPKIRPEQYDYTIRFIADKEGNSLRATKTYGGMKALIDRVEENR
jgi:hypothetical protein